MIISLICLTFIILYGIFWQCLLLYEWVQVDETLETKQHSKRQLEQLQYFLAGLMGHVCMQQRGTSSSFRPHICSINEISPKKHNVRWQLIREVAWDATNASMALFVCVCFENMWHADHCCNLHVWKMIWATDRESEHAFTFVIH